MAEFGGLNSNTSTSGQDLAPSPASTKELEAIPTMLKLIPVLEPLIQKVVKEQIVSAEKKFTASMEQERAAVNRTLEKMIRNLHEEFQGVVKEQIGLALKRISPSMNQPSGESPNSSSPRRLKLRFGNKPSGPVEGLVFTGKCILGQDGTNLKIELVDENTNLIVKTGPESSGTVNIAFLRADTKSDEKEVNTSLEGCPCVNLNEGIGLVGKIYFCSQSKWTKKCKYMLVARFVEDFDGVSVIEAKSEVFTLKDSRNSRNKCRKEKHKLPTLSDEVMCLHNIGKSGPYEKRLKEENIITVKNFLTEHFKNHQRLKGILKMPEKKLNDTIEHALTCKELEDKYIYYIPDSQQQKGIVLNVVGNLFGRISRCKLIPIETLSEEQKDEAQKLVVSALEHWGDVVPYNEHPLFSSHSDLVSHDYTPSIAGHDYTPLRTSSPNNILFGTSPVNRYDYNPPITTPLNGTLSDNFIGTSVGNGGYDHMQPNTSHAKATLSNILVETSQINGRSDVTKPSASLFSPDLSNDACHVNCEFDDKQTIAAPEDITPLNDTFSYPLEGTSDGVYSDLRNLFYMEFGTLNDFPYESPRSCYDIPDHLIQDPNFSADEYLDPDESLEKDRSKDRSREWDKMNFVRESSHRMKMENLGHVQKRLKFN